MLVIQIQNWTKIIINPQTKGSETTEEVPLPSGPEQAKMKW